MLKAWHAGESAALDRLVPLVYEELHRAAQRYMRRENSGNTLQTTALINEVYLRLVDLPGVSWLATYKRCDEALQEDRKTMELDRNATHLGMIHERMARCYDSKGMEKESLEEWVKARTAYGATPREIEEFKKAFAESGYKGALRKDLQRLQADWDKGHWHLNALRIAQMYGELGDDQAFEWLDKAIQLRSTALFWLYDGDNALRKDPRFADVKHKMGVDYLR